MAIVVDDPIVNLPFEEPTRHYRIRGGQTELVPARRPSGYMPGLRTRGGKQTLVEEEFVELQLLPVLDDLRGIGSINIAPFLTSRGTETTLKSHVSHAVIDSGWERTVAKALDESARIAAWAKNVRLGFTIPYQHQGIKHDFTPDFICRLRDATGEASDESLVIEVKGLEREADRSKDVGAKRWADAVNHWGKLGTWRYAKIHTPYELSSVLGVVSPA